MKPEMRMGYQLGELSLLKPVIKKYRNILIPSFVAIIGLLLYIPNLGSVPLKMWDESIYGNVARHMVKDGYWLIPHMYWTPAELTPFFQKPPLVMWLQAISMKIFGITTFAVRLPIALLTILLGILTYQIGQYWYSWKTGLASGLVLFIMPAIYLYGHSGRSASLDVPLIFFGSVFVWLVIRGRKNSSLLLPAGLFAAAAVLTKGLAAGVFLVILAPYVIVNWRDYLNSNTIFGAVVAWGTILPWPIYVWSQYPEQVTYGLILRQVDRATGARFVQPGDPFFPFMNYPYFDLIFTSESYAPFFLISIIFVIYEAYKNNWSDISIERFLLWWALAPPLTFALVGGNHSWYVLPMVVPIALLCGRAVEKFTHWWNSINLNRNDKFGISDKRYIIIGVLLAFSIPFIYPMLGSIPDNTSTQEQVGNQFSNIPDDAVIYLEPGVLEPGHFPFAFYANRPLEILAENQLQQDSTVQYAVVSTETLTHINRNYQVITKQGDVVAIKLG